jgi:CelD/BcsL family acetyltransferase involved in cellulose biosynthesis
LQQEQAPARRLLEVGEAHVIDPIADPTWLDLVETSPTSEAFHHPRWLRLLRDQYGYGIEAVCIANGAGIEAGIPIARVESRLTGRRLVSLPFSDTCAPVLAAGSDGTAPTALGEALFETVRTSGLALTVHESVPGAPSALVEPAFYRHLLSLDADPERVERDAWSQAARRGARRAEREGLRVERREDGEALDAFYALHLATRRRLGVPTQPRRFIRRFEQLFEAGLGFVQIVRDAGRPVAAAVFLTHNSTLTYKYGASDAASLGKRPNNALFAETIRWACRHGMRKVDFGRTEVDNAGLRRFKRSWGAREEPLAYTHLGERTQPVGGSRERIMSATIRRSPPLVGRLVGESLYRHFA